MRRGFEWKTQRTLFGLPLVCIAFGRDEKGKIRVARGVVAVGQVAIGAVAIGQFGVGVIFSCGQAVCGLFALGQLAAGFGAVGQVALGYLALGQIALGVYAMAQIGWGTFLWSGDRQDMEVLSVFYTIKMILTGQFDLASKIWTWCTETLQDLLAPSSD
ncbi:MAG: hypothetical protein ACP5M0_09185 [Desulfomonilaceae bacterium]